MRRSGFVVLLAALALALPASAGKPVSRAQLAEMARQKVDTALIVSLVEQDCVDFEVTGENLAELSKELPKEVLRAAMECRKARPAPATGKPKAAAPARAPEAPRAEPRAQRRPEPAPDPDRSPAGRLRVVETRKLGDVCCIDELRYPCDVPGQVWVQTRHAFGRTEHHTLDVKTGRFTDDPPPCTNPRTKVTSDEEGPADFSPDGTHQVVRSSEECGYMDDKCHLSLDGHRLSVEGDDDFKYPQFVWIDGTTVFLTNFGGVGGGPDGFWLLKLAPEAP